MTTHRVCWSIVMLLAGLAGAAAAADWPQWRGPERNGVAPAGVTIAGAWPKAGPRKLWESEKIPSRGEGGYSCVSVADGRAYVYVNWKYKVPIATRTLSVNGLRQLGWTDKMPPAELIEAVEKARVSDRRAKLKGKELQTWSAQWVKEHLPDKKDQQKFGGFIRDRLHRGKGALSLEVLEKLAEIKDKTFPTQAELDKWLAASGLPEKVKKLALQRIPTHKDAARDVVLCFDAADGKRLWKREYPGRPHGWSTSSTPCIADGRCYVAGVNGLVYCLDAKTGDEIWKAKTPGNPGHDVSSSVLVLDGKVIVMCQPLTALAVADGKVLWSQKAVSGRYSSPSLWRTDGKTYLVCNGAGNKVACVDPGDGKVLWTVPGGNSSSAVVAGDVAVVLGNNKKVGVTAYKMSAAGAEKLWTAEYWDRGASPLVYQGHVYVVVNSNKGRFACIELKTGRIAWDQQIGGTEFSSPVGIDGKVLAVTANGGKLLLLQATAEKYTVLAESRLPICQCTSPTVVGGKLFLRLNHAIACYDLTQVPGVETRPTEGKK